MELSKMDGFFKTHCHNIRNSLTAEAFDEFEKLTCDKDRYKFVHNLDQVQKFQVTRESYEKNLQTALELKKKGNTEFQKQNWKTAFDFYNQSYYETPSSNKDEMAIILANRSAVLHHTQMYGAALKDIARAIELGYPQNLLYKLKERQAKCYLAIKDHLRATDSFKETIKALDNGKLPEEKRAKMERDAQVMIKLMAKNAEMEKKLQQNKKKMKGSKKEESRFINSAITFDYNEAEGRFAKADKDIKVGDVLVVEKPHCSVLLESFGKTHCHNCCVRLTAPLCCPNCKNALFCSETCRNFAMSGCHKIECGILALLWRSGSSVICHMALRMMAQKDAIYFSQLIDQLKKTGDEISFDVRIKFPNDDYKKIYDLERHENDRTANDLFQHTVMANFLAACLDAAGYFPTTLEDDQKNQLGGLILRNLQILQFNTHEVFELQRDTKMSSGNRKTVFIGGALYPTVSLFNHSCDPGVVRYFIGNTVHVQAIKNIQKDEVVAENYGPIYTQVSREERRNLLKKQYFFDCNCIPCLEAWPLFEDMNVEILRFKCDNEKIKCPNVILVPTETNEFMIKCVQCGEYTNILKGLKAVQDTDMINKTADRLYNNGETDKALAKYLEMIKIMSEYLVPPFRDFTLCQQNVRNCMLENGNRFIIN